MPLVAGAEEVTGIVVCGGGWDAALKMSITVLSAQGVSHGLTISAAPSSRSRIPPHKPSHPASAQTNTTNTYIRHQRRKRVQRSAAMWPQQNIEPR